MASPGLASVNGVRDLIRQAEKSIASGNFDRALALLGEARTADPSNDYISAIIERVMLLDGRHEPREDASAPVVAQPSSEVSLPEAAEDLVEDIGNQVHRLTSLARDLFARGAYDSAFETLMNAFLLDPTSRDVLQTERTIMPAIAIMRQRSLETAPRPSASQILTQHMVATEGGNTLTGESLLSEAERIELLRHQRETEREEKERAMWRKASEPPRVLGANALQQASTGIDVPSAPMQPPKAQGRLFSRLRHGKSPE